MSLPHSLLFFFKSCLLFLWETKMKLCNVLQGFILWMEMCAAVGQCNICHPSFGREILLLSRSKRFFSSPKCPAWLWGPPSLLVSLHLGICSPGVNWPGHELDHSLQCCVRLRVIGAVYISTPPICLYRLHREKLAFSLPCHPWSAMLWLVACRLVILSRRIVGWYKIFKLSLRGGTSGFIEFMCFLKHETLLDFRLSPCSECCMLSAG